MFPQNRIQIVTVLLTVFLCLSAGQGETYEGKVFDHESKKPVAGALVSLGYSLYRTTTDSAGHFSLEIPEDGIHPGGGTSHLQPRLSIRWNARQHSMDLSDAAEISTVSVYRLDGTLVCRIFPAHKARSITLPVFAPGIYLASFTRTDNSFFVWKLAAAPGQGVQTITARAHAVSRTAVAARPDGVKVLFRHDNYFPLDRDYFAPAEDLEVEMSFDTRSFVFDQSEVRSYSFTISREDSLFMEKNAPDEEYIPAEFSFNGVPIGRVGFRYKGSDYTLNHCFDAEGNRRSYPECKEVSLKVKFNEYDDDLRFYAMKKLNLHAMPWDDSKLREMLAYQAFRDMGIYTCRTAFAKVYVNGVFRGLFTAVENVDGRFTKSRWPQWGDGNLYKEAWPFRLNRAYYKLALQTNDKPEDSADVNRMLDFYRAVKASTEETFIDSVGRFIDFDYFLRYIVVDRAIHNSDGIMTWYSEGNYPANHNYYFYEEENPGGRFWLIPWDLNATFNETDEIVDGFGLPEWNVVPDSCGPVLIWGGDHAIPPNCDPLTGLTAATRWKRFVEFGEEFLSTVFTADRMKAQVERLAKIIEPVMAGEPSVGPDDWKDAVKYLSGSMEVLHQGFDDYIHDRTPPLDTAGFLTPFPGDSGFLAGRVNNFEFDASVPISEWTVTDASDSSSVELRHNTGSPLWGSADMLGSFIFRPLDTDVKYAEWGHIGFRFGEPVDFSKLRRIKVNLQCDVPRYCTVGLESDAYARHSVNDYYGWSGTVSAMSRQYIFEMKNIGYPSWADPGNPDILDSVLTSVQGIGFVPNPLFDADGNLSTAPDTGYMHIDNIIFEFE